MSQDEILSLKQENIELNEKTKKLAFYLNKFKEDKAALTRQLQEKEEEIVKLKEKIIALTYNKKSSSKEVKEYSVESKKLNITLQPIVDRQQDPKMLGLINNFKITVDDKNLIIKNMMEEITELRSKLEELKENEQTNYKFIIAKLSKHNIDNEYIKQSKEFSSLKYLKQDLELKVSEIKEEKEDLIKENISYLGQIENLNQQINSSETKNKIKHEKEKYYNLLNNYRVFACISEHNTLENKRLKYFNELMQQDMIDVNNLNLQLKNKLIEVESEIEKYQILIRGNQSELEYLREKNKSLKQIIDEMQLSKKSYIVSYYYLGISYEGRIIFEKVDENEYTFKIETKMSTRKINWLDYDAFIDSANNIVKFKSKTEGTEEDYYSEDYNKIYSDFELFKKKSIETSKLKTINTSVGVSTVFEKKEKDLKNLKDKENQVRDMFGF